jgi:hypothetical protein
MIDRNTSLDLEARKDSYRTLVELNPDRAPFPRHSLPVAINYVYIPGIVL